MGLEEISGYEMTARGDGLYDRVTGQTIELKNLDGGRLAHLVFEVREQRRQLADVDRILSDELRGRMEQKEMTSDRFGSFVVERRVDEKPYVRVKHTVAQGKSK